MLHPTDAKLYLPISDELLDAVLDEPQGLPQALAGLAVPQLAALIVVDRLGAAPPVPSPARLLAELITLGNRWVRQGGLPAFAAQVAASLDRDRLEAGRDRLVACAVMLLGPSELLHRGYLTGEEEWDSAFHERHREKLLRQLTRVAGPTGGGVLTLQQGQVYREIEAQIDEHAHVQGYAGVGKSHLITKVLNMLVAKGATVALVAERQAQLDALVARAGRIHGVWPMTFEGLMDEVVPPDLTDPSARRMRRRDRSKAMLSDIDLARNLGIHPGGEISPAGLARIVRGIVSSFCRSDAAEIGEEHIPPDAPAMDGGTRLLVLHHATELWQATHTPAAGFRPPLRDYHRIKQAALRGWNIPARYTHVVMDECHDLPRPLLKIVEDSPQAVITLGDEYQNLKGRPRYRGDQVRQRNLTVSVRSGAAIEGIVNPIILAHPGRTKLEFKGSDLRQLEIIHYDRVEVPAEPAVVLVHDEWGLFEWAQRLAGKGDFALLGSASRLDLFVSDCIELYRHHTRPRHGALFRFASWEAVAAVCSGQPGFGRIDRMLAKGYTEKDWARTLERARGSAAGVALAMVGDVRNREFPTVMLAPDVMDWAGRAPPGARAEAASVIYVAVTRAQRRLYLPRRLQGWIEDLAPAVAPAARGRLGRSLQ